MSDQLEIPRFQLDSIKAFAKIRVDYMAAIASFNNVMADAAVKQANAAAKRVKTAADKAKLAHLRRAVTEYQRALKETKKQQKTVERKWATIEKRVHAAARLEWGELIDFTKLTSSWAGLEFLIKQMPGKSRRKVMRNKVGAQHRKKSNFIKPRFPNVECDNAPATIKTTVSLFRWAREERCLPRNGSATQDRLFQVMDLVEESAAELVRQSRSDLVDIRAKLLELRKLGWKAIEISDNPPKEVK